MLTISDTAKRLNVGRSTVDRLIAERAIRVVKIGKRYRIPEDALAEYLDRNTRPIDDSPARRVTSEKSTCHTNSRNHRTGGSATQTRADAELDALLGPRTTPKPKPSSSG